ncbi:hypothetical protein [Povalibacter sp.]|uniref:hypothetical protein n=1 Tax=Povalibacter sp. TaxID=1962978 RepID=UPI002F4301A1
MHATVHQLLSLRDGEPVDAEAARHVERCAVCTAELARLGRVQQGMQSLAPLEPPDRAWQQVAERLQVATSSRKTRVPRAFAAAAVVVVVSGLLFRQLDAPIDELPSAQIERDSAEEVLSLSPLDQLVAQSQELDQMLQYLPERPAVERVALAVTIDTIEERVQWLDQQLSYAHDTGLNDAQATQLWRERVDLMDSLVKVRYAEGAPLSF